MNPIDEIIDLVDRYGAEEYGDERVTQQAHALQSAALAEAAGSRPALIAGALLHDLGHLLDKHAERGRQEGIDRLHEQIGAGWVQRFFQPEVAAMVRLHVPAKRWLCRCEPGYFETLSPGSVRSLALQGGPFTPEEAAAFHAQPGAEDAIQVRRWDDLAKVQGLATPPLAHYIPTLKACLL